MDIPNEQQPIANEQQIQSPIQESVVPQSVSPKSKISPLVFIAIFCAIIIAGGIYYLFIVKPTNKNQWPTPVPTIAQKSPNSTGGGTSGTSVPPTSIAPATTKTYTSKYNNFSFNYPSEYRYTEKVVNQPLIPGSGKKYEGVNVEFVNKPLSDKSQPSAGQVIYFSYISNPDFLAMDLDNTITNLYGNLYISSKNVDVNEGLKIEEVHYNCYLQEDKECAAIIFIQKDTLFNLSDPSSSDLTIPYLFLSTLKFTQ